MGNYYFTDLSGNEAKVEYTFGYKLIEGELKLMFIIRHFHFKIKMRHWNEPLYFLCARRITWKQLLIGNMQGSITFILASVITRMIWKRWKP